jgi:hypothetical protein
MLEELILQEEGKGHRIGADVTRILLSEILLQIVSQNERVPLTTLAKNLLTLLKVMFTGSSRITALIASVLENPQLDREAPFVGRAQMILGLLYKAKKKRALALQHLTEAKRIFSQFGQSPILARVEISACGIGKIALTPPRYGNSSISSFASFRSRVSNPSVNHPYTGASSSRACCILPRERQRRARLMAARSSQDLACCCRATESARSKYVSALAKSRSATSARFRHQSV